MMIVVWVVDSGRDGNVVDVVRLCVVVGVLVVVGNLELFVDWLDGGWCWKWRVDDPFCMGFVVVVVVVESSGAFHLMRKRMMLIVEVEVEGQRCFCVLVGRFWRLGLARILFFLVKKIIFYLLIIFLKYFK
jgi:hypothetical protein